MRRTVARCSRDALQTDNVPTAVQAPAHGMTCVSSPLAHPGTVVLALHLRKNEGQMHLRKNEGQIPERPDAVVPECKFSAERGARAWSGSHSPPAEDVKSQSERLLEQLYSTCCCNSESV